jgi:hypothetical protein
MRTRSEVRSTSAADTTPSTACARRGPPGGVGPRQDDGRLHRPRGEGLGRCLGAQHGFRHLTELLALRQPDLHPQGRGGERQQRRGTGSDDERRTPGRRAPEPAPQAPLPAGAAQARHEGPERGAAEDHEGAGQHHQAGQHRHRHAQGRTRAEGPGVLHLREQQRQHRQHDGASAGQDRAAGPRHRHPHRIVRAGGAPQLLAVPRDQQQRIVRRGTEDEDADDADGAAVVDQAEGGEQHLHQPDDDLLRSRDHGQRHDDQQRAAVGHGEDHRHHQRGHEEDVDVGAGEDGGEVRREGRPAGDLGDHAGRQVRQAARRSTTASPASRTSSPGTSGTGTRATVPSAEVCAGGNGRTMASPGTEPTASRTAATSPSTSREPSSRLTTTTAAWVCDEGSCCRSWSTCTDW